MKYLSWKEENILTPESRLPSEKVITDMYAQGFVFTRIGKGVMQQTRAVRIDLAAFEMSSENRRIVRKIGAKIPPETNYLKTDSISKIHKNLVNFNDVVEKENEASIPSVISTISPLPLAPADYHWSMAKVAKDFYEKKFGPGVMSAVKVKELLTDATKSNFNTLFSFALKKETGGNNGSGSASGITPIGAAICYKNSSLLHYSYPFYDLSNAAVPKDVGLGMMILAIEHAKNAGLRYIYLGSLQRPSDTYKLQFKGLEWFDGGPEGTDTWQTDIEKVKTILK